MQYDQYQGKVKRVAALLAKVYAVRLFIIIPLAILAALGAALVACRGLVLSESACPAEVVYGEVPVYEAKALMAEVSFEYRRQGESEWSAETPDYVGAYQVRAVSASSFGTPRYGDVHDFTVVPRPITPAVLDAEILYGDTPQVGAATVGEDRLSCAVVYESFEIGSVGFGDEQSGPVTEAQRTRIGYVRVDADTVAVTDGEGNDRTACYTVADTPLSAIVLIPRPLTVTVQDAEKVYDGAALSFDGYEITEGTLAEGDTLMAVFGDSIVMAGTLLNTPRLEVMGADGQSKTDLYAIYVRAGTLTVEKRPLIVETGSSTTVYNGYAQTNHQFEVDASTPLVEGHRLMVESSPFLQDCGTEENTQTFAVLDENGERVSDNYSIFVKPGTLTVVPREITVSTDSASFIYDGLPHSHPSAIADLPDLESLMVINGTGAEITDAGSVENSMTVQMFRGAKNVTSNYIITYEYGTLTVEPRPIVVKIADAEKIYDGIPLTSEKYAVVVNSPIWDIDPPLDDGLNIEDETFVYDTLYPTVETPEIDPADPTQFFPENMYTDGALDSEVNADGLPEVLYQLVDGHVLTLSTEGSVIFGVGESRCVAGSVRVEDLRLDPQTGHPTVYPYDDVTANYTVTVLPGTLTVTERPITVVASDAEKVYDGEPLKEAGYTVLAPEQGPDGGFTAGLVDGHSLQALTVGQQTDAGTSPNTFDPAKTRILDGEGQDVTGYYAISYREGTLTVVPCQIKVATASGEWTYDGQPHSDGTMTFLGLLNGGRFVEGHTLVNLTSPLPSVTDVGSVENRLEVTVMDGETSVAHNYEIICEYGTLTVIPRPITVRTHTYDPWVYDNLSHPGNWELMGVTVVKGSLVEGHCTVSEQITTLIDVGTAENIQTVTIFNADWAEMTHNYEITCEYGTLTVEPRPVTVRIPDKTWVYNGRAEEVTAGYAVDVTSPYGLAWGHGLAAARMDPAPTYTNAGTYKNTRPAMVYETETGEDITANYDLSYVYGSIVITPRPLIIRLDGEKVYDDTPLAGEDVRILYLGEYTPCEGHTLTIDPEATITDAGTMVSYPDASSLRICKDTEDVTENYAVTYESGWFTVLHRPIGVKSRDDVKLYDGTPLIQPDGYVTDVAMSLVSSHVLFVNAYGSGVEVGTYPNTVDPGLCRITNAVGVDKTHNYYIERVDEGTLTVLAEPIRLTVWTGSDQKMYDGLPLECREYSLGGDDLPAGYQVNVLGFASLTQIGGMVNFVDLAFEDGNGNLLPNEVLELETDYGMLWVFDPNAEMESITVGQVHTTHDGVLYLREDSYDSFDRRTWSDSGKPYGQTLLGGYGYQYLPAKALDALGIEPTTAMFRDMFPYLFMLPYYTQIGGSAPAVGSDTVNREDGFGLTAYTAEYYFTGSGTDLVALYMKLTPEERSRLMGEYADEELAYRAHVYENYLYVHPETKAFLQTIIDEQGFDPADPEVIAKVARYIQTAAVYNDDPVLAAAIESSEDAVIAFLRDYKEGLCRQYASSAAMMYRTLGIPARYAVGFMLEVSAGKWNDITTPGHAWVEVYLDGLGWVAVEVTGSDGSGSGSGSGEGECDGSCGGECDGSCSGGGSGEPLPELEIIPVSLHKEYDGTELVSSNELVLTPSLEELLKQGYTYTVYTVGSQLTVGESDSKLVSFTLYDPDGQDVTDRFEIIERPGLLQVTQRPLEVFLYPQEKTYDGQPAIWSLLDYEIMTPLDGLNFELVVRIPATGVGSVTLSDLNRVRNEVAFWHLTTPDGEDVSDNYTLVFVPLTDTEDIPVLSVIPRIIELTAVSETRVYVAGQAPLQNPAVYISKGKLVDGHTLTASAMGKQAKVGSSANVVDPDSVVILDADGQNMSRNYKFVPVDGTLTLLEGTD